MAAPLAHVIREATERTPRPARRCQETCWYSRRRSVPADCRISVATNLAIDEAALTGESAAITKDRAAIPELKLPIGDRRTWVYVERS